MSMHNQGDRRRRRHFSGYLPRVGKKQRWTAGLTAVLVGGVIFGNCRASEITSPSFSSRSKPSVSSIAKVSRSATPTQKTTATLVMDPIVTNPCNGEGVTVDGQTILTLTSQTSASGNFHVTMETVTKGKGVAALTGTDYVIDSRDFTETELGPATETTTLHKQVYNSQGTLPNFVNHKTMHVTVNALGVPSATVANGPGPLCNG